MELSSFKKDAMQHKKGHTTIFQVFRNQMIALGEKQQPIYLLVMQQYSSPPVRC